ncbi:MAG: helix-turn-helix domain-containing protein [Planctomycetota bacterium]
MTRFEDNAMQPTEPTTPTAPPRAFEVLLTRREVAAMLGVCPGTVDNLRRRGELAVVRVARRMPRFPESAVRAYLDRAARV